MNSTDRPAASRYRPLSAALAFVAILAIVVWLAWPRSGEGSTNITEPQAIGSTVPSGTDTSLPETSSSGRVTTVPATEPDEGTLEAPPTAEPADLMLPSASIPETDESSTCRAIVKELEAYRDLAANEPLSALPILQLGLEEFEHEIDFLAQGHEWGNSIVGQLVLVRRDWSTAYSAAESGDQADAEHRFSAAMDYLDTAIAVDCPSN